MLLEGLHASLLAGSSRNSLNLDCEMTYVFVDASRVWQRERAGESLYLDDDVSSVFSCSAFEYLQFWGDLESVL